MTGAVARIELEVVVEEREEMEVEQGPLLAAALAAALVEYRRHVRQRNGYAEPDNSRTNWHMVSRLEQLWGQA
jgi:hypothetical protein